VKTFVNQPIPPDIFTQLFKISSQRLKVLNIIIGLKQFLPFFFRIRLNPTFMALSTLTNTFYSILYIDDKIAGYCAGFSYHDEKLIIPFLAIDSNFSRYSPGGILITETIKFLVENYKFKYFDLSRGDENYKLVYGGVKHSNFHYEISPTGEDYKSIANLPADP
jgi:hypothetical protein